MEILIGIVISTLTEISKWIVSKLGKEMGKKLVTGVVFVLCVVGAYLYKTQIISTELIKEIISFLLIAVGYYELVYKRILTPVFNALVNKK